jgi:hypothetical protein
MSAERGLVDEVARLLKLADLHNEECRKVGLSEWSTPETLVRHWQGNAGLTGYINGKLGGDDAHGAEETLRLARIGAWVEQCEVEREFVWHPSNVVKDYVSSVVYRSAALAAGAPVEPPQGDAL